MASLKGNESKEAFIVEDMENRDDVQEKHTEPLEDLEELNIDPSRPE